MNPRSDSLAPTAGALSSAPHAYPASSTADRPAASSDAELGSRVDAVLDDTLRDERLVGAEVLVARDGRVVYHRAAGLADREAGRPMREDAIFRYASFSKPIVSVAALALLEAGALDLDDPVTRWLPDFRPRLADGRTPTITVRHLLTHTSGLGYRFLQAPGSAYDRADVSDGLDQPGLSFEQNARRLASVPLLDAPGAAFHYSLSTDVLGAVLARASGATLPGLVARLVTGPLGMRETGFKVADPARLVVPYEAALPRPVRMADQNHVVRVNGIEVRFAPARILDPASYPSGGAGMAGTASDFLKFLEALRLGGGPVLRAESVAAMTRNQIGAITSPLLGEGWGFGLGAAVLLDPARASSSMTAGSFRWEGAYGHHWWVDPAERLAVIVLTNTAPEGMAGRFPTELQRAVYGR